MGARVVSARRSATTRVPQASCRRSVARVAAVDDVVVRYAAAYCGLPVRRRQDRPHVTWSIDRDVVVRFVHDGPGPSRLLVHDIGLVGPLRKHLRSRHQRIVIARG